SSPRPIHLRQGLNQRPGIARWGVDSQLVERFYGACGHGTPQRFRERRRDCYCREWRRLGTGAGSEVTPQPSAANRVAITLAMLHLVLCFKMGSGGIVRAYGLNYREPPLFIDGNQRSELWMEPVEIIQPNGAA